MSDQPAGKIRCKCTEGPYDGQMLDLSTPGTAVFDVLQKTADGVKHWYGYYYNPDPAPDEHDMSLLADLDPDDPDDYHYAIYWREQWHEHHTGMR